MFLNLWVSDCDYIDSNLVFALFVFCSLTGTVQALVLEYHFSDQVLYVLRVNTGISTLR